MRKKGKSLLARVQQGNYSNVDGSNMDLDPAVNNNSHTSIPPTISNRIQAANKAGSGAMSASTDWRIRPDTQNPTWQSLLQQPELPSADDAILPQDQPLQN